jgi:hypothetical protein
MRYIEIYTLKQLMNDSSSSSSDNSMHGIIKKPRVNVQPTT